MYPYKLNIGLTVYLNYIFSRLGLLTFKTRIID
jgi:hypothetical protein